MERCRCRRNEMGISQMQVDMFCVESREDEDWGNSPRLAVAFTTAL